MPEFAPFSKVERTRSFGARVVLTGDTLDASAQADREIAAKETLTFVHPYDEAAVIAGQATIGPESMHDLPDPEPPVVPNRNRGPVSAHPFPAQEHNHPGPNTGGGAG